MLPTRLGMVFALLLLVMLLGSMNYSNSLGFMLTFLLAGMALVGMHHTHRNLLRLQVDSGHMHRVFAGETAVYEIRISNPSTSPRFSLQLAQTGSGLTDIGETDTRSLILASGRTVRGLNPAPRFKITSTYPLGLFQAWSWVELDMNCLAYPRPQGGKNVSFSQPAIGEGKRSHRGGNEDFSGLREYQRGDSPRLVHWRAAARTGELLVKQFTDMEDPEHWLDWEQFAGLSTEARLSRLCQCVLDSHRDGIRFGLKLPGKSIVPARGEHHRQQCLEALARFQAPADAGQSGPS